MKQPPSSSLTLTDRFALIAAKRSSATQKTQKPSSTTQPTIDHSLPKKPVPKKAVPRKPAPVKERLGPKPTVARLGPPVHPGQSQIASLKPISNKQTSSAAATRASTIASRLGKAKGGILKRLGARPSQAQATSVEKSNRGSSSSSRGRRRKN